MYTTYRLVQAGLICYIQHDMSTASPILIVKNLTYSIQADRPILKGLSFCIPERSFTLVTGPNGSGKSVLMRLLKGLLNPTSGTIHLDGIDVTGNPKLRMRQLGLVFQEADTQIVGQTVEKDICFGMENLNLPLEEQQARLGEILKILDLERQRNQRPRTLSGGEKRRLAIAGVLVMQPRILMLDEPFANLDYRSVVSVLKALLELHQSGCTIVVVCHEVEKILAHADHVLLLDEGTIRAEGEPREVLPFFKEHGVYMHEGLALEELSWLRL